MIVANAVAVAPTSTERLSGSTAATSGDVPPLAWVKLADTLCAAFMVTVQVPTPLHAPLHPAKLNTAPAVKFALQVGELQLNPAGDVLTVPEPAMLTESAKLGVVPFLKVALTVSFAFIATVQPPVPLHAPPQPVKLYPVAGDAVSVTAVPEV